MNNESIEQHDGRRIRCRLLGHEITFAYCRRPGRELPCGKIFDCWFEIFPVEEFIRAHYSPEQIDRIRAPAPDKITQLLDIIQQARQNQQPGRTCPKSDNQH